MSMLDGHKFGGKLHGELKHHRIPLTVTSWKEAEIETSYLIRHFLHFYGLFGRKVLQNLSFFINHTGIKRLKFEGRETGAVLEMKHCPSPAIALI